MFSIAMQTIESAMSVSMSGGNQRARGARSKADAMSVIECATAKAVTIGHEGPEPANRDGEADEEEQVIRTAEDVAEPQLHESPGRLVPARIEADESGVADPLEGPDGTAGREEPHGRGDAHAEPRERRIDRERGSIRTDVVLEQDVEQRLIPVDPGVGVERRARDVREGLLVAHERAIGRQRDACRCEARARRASCPFSWISEGRHQPERGGVGERAIDRASESSRPSGPRVG